MLRKSISYFQSQFEIVLQKSSYTNLSKIHQRSLERPGSVYFIRGIYWIGFCFMNLIHIRNRIKQKLCVIQCDINFMRLGNLNVLTDCVYITTFCFVYVWVQHYEKTNKTIGACRNENIKLLVFYMISLACPQFVALW